MRVPPKTSRLAPSGQISVLETKKAPGAESLLGSKATIGTVVFQRGPQAIYPDTIYIEVNAAPLWVRGMASLKVTSLGHNGSDVGIGGISRGHSGPLKRTVIRMPRR